MIKNYFNLSIKNIQFVILLFILTICSLPSIAQENNTIKGTITNKNGEALQGVSIKVNGAPSGTLSDASGHYQLNVSTGYDTLTISYLGYESQEVSVNNRTIIDIALASKKINLNQLVVTGYSEQKKKDITGSVVSVDMKALQSIPTSSAERALQGQAAGVTVISSGSPGSESKVYIRGITSFGNNQPLVLIDGVEGDLNNIDAGNIKSIEVLKDAGAASIYGVRGSNGVILVTTKKGKSGPPTFSYHGYFGFQFPKSGNPLNLVNSKEFVKLYKIAYPNSTFFDNKIPDYSYGGPGAGINGFANEGDPKVDPSKYVLNPSDHSRDYLIQKLNKTGTDWFHALFKRAPETNHTISVGGGSDRSRYFLSLGYVNQEGTLIETYLKKYSARVNTQFDLPGNIQIGENLNYFYKDNKLYNSGAINEVFLMEPLVPVHDIKGNFGSTTAGPSAIGDRSNPVADQEATKNNKSNQWRISGDIYAKVDFLKDFSFRTQFGGAVNHTYNRAFSPVRYWFPEALLSPNGYSESAAYNSTYKWTNTLIYSNEFGKHYVKLLLGSEAINNYGRNLGGSSKGFLFSDFNYLILDNGSSDITNTSGGYSDGLFSLFGKLNYIYNNKYLLSFTIRRDGASQFGSNNKYGLFPAVSAGWRISNENFIRNIKWIDNLKIKASYGVLGSKNNISPDNAYTLFGSNLATSYYNITGGTNQIQLGLYQENIGNPNTEWERDIVSDIGFNAVLINNISISFDLYKKEIKGLLFSKPLPATVGGASPPIVNVGNIKNVGFDITGKYFGSINHDLKFNVRVNFTSYKNTIVKIPDPGYFSAGSDQIFGFTIRNQEGHPISSFYGYKVIGLFDSEEEVSKSPEQKGAAPGTFNYKDINGDGTITPADRTFLGDPNPDFTCGVNIRFKYKGFGLYGFFYGSQGNKILNATKEDTYFFGTYLGTKSKALLNAWTPNNKNTKIPKIIGGTSFSTLDPLNSFFIEDGSFLKLKSLMLGYSFNSSSLKKLGIKKLRLYLEATNLFTITKYSGLDPEIGGPSSSFGIDHGNYPNNFKSFILGVNFSF